MNAERQAVTVTTAAANGTMYSGNATGRIVSIRYVKTDFADGSTFTITGETTGINIWTETAVNASATRATRQPTHQQDGTAQLYGAGAAYAVNDDIVLANERIKIAVTAGGAAKTGVFHITLDGSFSGEPSAS